MFLPSPIPRYRAVALIVVLLASLASGSPPRALATGLEALHVLDAASLAAGTAAGLDLREDALVVADTAPRGATSGLGWQFGIADSWPIHLPGPSSITSVRVHADPAPDGAIEVLLRGLRNGQWTEWREPARLRDLDGLEAFELRAVLRGTAGPASPALHRVEVRSTPVRLLRAAQAASGPPTVRLWATRIGLVGRTTANGHVVGERDRFVALPSKRALNRLAGTDYQVQVSYRGRVATAPVWDVGPWNTQDDYWNEGREAFSDLPRWTSQAEAAFFAGHNAGRDGTNRFVTVPTSIDLADGLFWDDLGMTANDWVDVSFLWLNAPSPPVRPAIAVEPKSPPTPVAAPALTGARAASFNALAPANRFALPLVVRGPGGWTTTWTVQNPLGQPVAGTIELFSEGGGRAASLPFELPAYGWGAWGTEDVEGLPADFSGAAIVSAGGPIAVVVDVDRPGMDRAAYEGVPYGASSAALPLVFREHRGWTSAVHLHNLEAGAATVQVTYVGPTGPLGSEVLVLPARGGRTVPSAGSAAPLIGFAGAVLAQVLSGGSIAVMAHNVHADGSATAYAAQGTGLAALYAPVVFKRYNGWDTGVQLLNLGVTAATASVSYQTSPSVAVEGATVPPRNTSTLYQPAAAQLPVGFSGGATIAAAARNARLVGLVNGIKAGAPAALAYALGQAPAALLAVPAVTKGADGWDTDVRVQNASGGGTTVVATFYDAAGAPVHRLEESLAPGATWSLDLPAIPEIPAGFRGAALLQSTTGAGLVAVASAATR